MRNIVAILMLYVPCATREVDVVPLFGPGLMIKGNALKSQDSLA